MSGKVWKSLGFATRADLETHIRSIVSRTPNCVPLSSVDADFMTRVFEHHDEWVSKMGVGVSHIEVAPPEAYPRQRCFWIVRLDGSRVDISWRHAISGEVAQTARSTGCDGYDVRSAARLAIEPQIRAARFAQKRGSCWVCGEAFGIVGPTARTDVDHHGTSFEQLLREWLQNVGGPKEVPLRDAGAHAEMTDAEQRADWCEYHRIWADLRLVHTPCHKKITALRTKDWT